MKICSMSFLLCAVFFLINCVGISSSKCVNMVFISAHPELSARNQQQEALIAAVRAHDSRAVKRLLESGLDPNYLFGDSPVTPLSEAIAEGQPETITLLLNHGADANFGAEKGVVPLAAASWYGEKETVSELLKRAAKIEARDSQGYTAFSTAASHSQGVSLIKILLAAAPGA